MAESLDAQPLSAFDLLVQLFCCQAHSPLSCQTNPYLPEQGEGAGGGGGEKEKGSVYFSGDIL